jgi:hypothetical protein
MERVPQLPLREGPMPAASDPPTTDREEAEVPAIVRLEREPQEIPADSADVETMELAFSNETETELASTVNGLGPEIEVPERIMEMVAPVMEMKFAVVVPVTRIGD